MVAVVTLSPFRFAAAPVNSLSWRLDAFDVVMNVVMFIPLGFTHRLARPGARHSVAGALLLGAALSGLVESLQLFAPGRFPSLVDVATNTAGAVAGALLANSALRRADGATTARAFSVELPLMGLAYLLLPLAWLLGVDSDLASRGWLLAPVSVCAAWIIASVFTSFDGAGIVRVLSATGMWLAVALLPAALNAPASAAVAAVMALVCAGLRRLAAARVARERGATGAERRFEAATLNFVLPILVLYLVLSAWPLDSAQQSHWSFTFALLRAESTPPADAIFRAVAHISAFAVLGYAVAEYLGRARDTLPRLVPIVVAASAVLSAVLEVARGWYSAHVASALMFTLTIGAATLGSVLYTLQLAHVRALVGR